MLSYIQRLERNIDKKTVKNLKHIHTPNGNKIIPCPILSAFSLSLSPFDTFISFCCHFSRLMLRTYKLTLNLHECHFFSTHEFLRIRKVLYFLELNALFSQIQNQSSFAKMTVRKWMIHQLQRLERWLQTQIGINITTKESISLINIMVIENTYKLSDEIRGMKSLAHVLSISTLFTTVVDSNGISISAFCIIWSSNSSFSYIARKHLKLTVSISLNKKFES